MQGDPTTMQTQPQYDFAHLDVLEFLEERIAACEAHGIPRSRIVVDPGFGFGKAATHNHQILTVLGIYRTTGCGVLVGLSRKSFIGRLAGVAAPKDRLAGSLAAAVSAVATGADIVRVHDVAETVQALRVVTALEADPDDAR